MQLNSPLSQRRAQVNLAVQIPNHSKLSTLSASLMSPALKQHKSQTPHTRNFRVTQRGHKTASGSETPRVMSRFKHRLIKDAVNERQKQADTLKEGDSPFIRQGSSDSLSDDDRDVYNTSKQEGIRSRLWKNQIGCKDQRQDNSDTQSELDCSLSENNPRIQGFFQRAITHLEVQMATKGDIEGAVQVALSVEKSLQERVDRETSKLNEKLQQTVRDCILEQEKIEKKLEGQPIKLFTELKKQINKI
jgi:hypothetical protein